MRNMITDIQEKINRIPPGTLEDIFVVAVVILVAVASFGLGRLSMRLEEKGEFQMLYPGAIQGNAGETVRVGLVQGVAAQGGGYVASKNGSKYHLPWCAGAQAIKEENKVWFESKEAAEAAGYAPAGNCKGL